MAYFRRAGGASVPAGSGVGDAGMGAGVASGPSPGTGGPGPSLLQPSASAGEDKGAVWEVQQLGSRLRLRPEATSWRSS